MKTSVKTKHIYSINITWHLRNENNVMSVKLKLNATWNNMCGCQWSWCCVLDLSAYNYGLAMVFSASGFEKKNISLTIPDSSVYDSAHLLWCARKRRYKQVTVKQWLNALCSQRLYPAKIVGVENSLPPPPTPVWYLL